MIGTFTLRFQEHMNSCWSWVGVPPSLCSYSYRFFLFPSLSNSCSELDSTVYSLANYFRTSCWARGSICAHFQPCSEEITFPDVKPMVFFWRFHVEKVRSQLSIAGSCGASIWRTDHILVCCSGSGSPEIGVVMSGGDSNKRAHIALSKHAAPHWQFSFNQACDFDARTSLSYTRHTYSAAK